MYGSVNTDLRVSTMIQEPFVHVPYTPQDRCVIVQTGRYTTVMVEYGSVLWKGVVV